MRRQYLIAARAFAPLLHAQQAFAPSSLTFDVASIHIHKDNTLNGGIKPLPGGHGYTSINIPVKLIISLMYKVPMRQIHGGPDWINTERWDIEARADGQYPADDLRAMFRNLLAERFKLKMHTETHEGNIYALTVDPAGIKMTPNTTPEDYEIPMQGPPAKATGKRVPMTYLCWYLGNQLQNDSRPCIDMTGLKGNYDFTLSFQPVLPPGASLDDLGPEYKDLPTLFEAVKQQLGLRLTPQKGPILEYTIDSIEKPTDN